MTQPDWNEIADYYRSGKSLEECAEKADRSLSCVWRHLVEAGVEMRSKAKKTDHNATTKKCTCCGKMRSIKDDFYHKKNGTVKTPCIYCQKEYRKKRSSEFKKNRKVKTDIKRFLRDHGIQHKDVAKLAGCQSSDVSNYIGGWRKKHQTKIDCALRELGYIKSWVQRDDTSIPWNPWVNGEIKKPHGVPNECMNMVCPF